MSPLHDLHLMLVLVQMPQTCRCTYEHTRVTSRLDSWSTIDHERSKAAVRKLNAHSDYLSGRSVVLSSAFDLVSDETKQKIAEAIL